MALRSRLDLQALLESILGSRNVYYQPPATIFMNYPCIVYSRESIDSRFADDAPYSHDIRYQVTVIERNPDSELPFKIASLEKCTHSRSFKADDLHHNTFTLYF